MVRNIKSLNILHLQFYKMRLLYLCVLVSLLFSSCQKDDSTIFNIELEKTLPLTLIQFEENILVRITYEHPDGYLGFSDPDYLSLEIKDSRLPNPDYYHLIPVDPPNHTLSTNGEIAIEIDAPFILGSSNIETLEFNIRIQDRELNWSNQLTTPSITVLKE